MGVYISAEKNREQRVLMLSNDFLISMNTAVLARVILRTYTCHSLRLILIG